MMLPTPAVSDSLAALRFGTRMQNL
jgi:hypothetical protein